MQISWNSYGMPLSYRSVALTTMICSAEGADTYGGTKQTTGHPGRA
jgi:hypothetical protein